MAGISIRVINANYDNFVQTIVGDNTGDRLHKRITDTAVMELYICVK